MHRATHASAPAGFGIRVLGNTQRSTSESATRIPSASDVSPECGAMSNTVPRPPTRPAAYNGSSCTAHENV